MIHRGIIRQHESPLKLPTTMLHPTSKGEHKNDNDIKNYRQEQKRNNVLDVKIHECINEIPFPIF